jgi:hypothetical protein
MDKIMSQCGFSSTTYTPAATTAVAGINVQATKPAVTLGSTTGTGAAPKSSTTGASAGVRLFDLGAMQCGLVLAGALAVFLGV